ncbi:MAG: nucleotidyltransferase family protein [Acidobacteria bacterium]|nr:nucleotidyltransferase family protein [Acidobacteriota bacterium]
MQVTAGAEPPTVSDADVWKWNILQSRLQERRTVQAVELFRSEGMEPIVIKGIAAERYYPAGEARHATDVDLAVSADDYDRAQKLILTEDAAGLAIDVHRELRQLDTVPWSDLLDNSITLTLTDGSVRVLRPEDDIRVLCVHWLTDGGMYKERLWDLYYGISGRSRDFDWARLLDVVSSRRRRWIECALGLTAKYLDLNIKGTPVEGADERLPDWLIKTVEKEWATELRFQPLDTTIHDRRLLLAQFKRRLRPNPIYATVDCEGSFDARTRIFYQMRNGLRRILPSIRRIKISVENSPR